MESQQMRVLVQLRDMILKGSFAPGERLAEIPLSEQLQASRTPVRLALTTLEQEGLVEPSPSGGYAMRRFTAKEIDDAIAVRGMLEGMAARLVAEHGLPRGLAKALDDCLAQGDRIFDKPEMDMDDYAIYIAMNDRLHGLVVDAAGNAALARAIELNNRLPFAAASAMLPMQPSHAEGRNWMWMAHMQHHALVEAMRAGESARAQALAEEHTQIARTNVRHAMENPDLALTLMPAMRLVDG